MKTRLVSVLIFGAAAAAAAQLATVEDLMTKIEAQPESERNYVVIPIAGDGGGRFGTSYRTDVSLEAIDYDDFPAAVAWLPLGLDASRSLLTFIPARSTWNDYPPVWTNFPTRLLDETGFGAIVVAGVDAMESDLYRPIVARVNVHVEATGSCAISSSMPFKGQRPSRAPQAAAAGFRLGGGYRTNVGIVNLDREPHLYSIRTLTSDGSDGSASELLVAPRSLSVAALPPAEAETTAVVAVETDSAGGEWTAWASSVHETSGDAWFAPLAPY
jgi:hypothetical protein